jgi:thiol-disulfide isomerase/thioredoxin
MSDTHETSPTEREGPDRPGTAAEPDHTAETAEPRDDEAFVTVGDLARALAAKPQTPRWVPAMIAIALAAGIGIGLVIGLVVSRDGDSGEEPAAVPTTIAIAAEGASPAAGPMPTEAPRPDPAAYGTVTVEGTPLPRVVDGIPDVAIGMTVPEVAGADYDGNSVEITNDGNAKMIVFLSHWCPYCRQETPIIRDWLDTATLPENVDVYSVSTLTNADRVNYPPAPWLETERWDIPLIADDDADTVANAFGLHAVPFWILVHTDGTLAGRGSGAVPPDALTEIAGLLSQGPEAANP